MKGATDSPSFFATSRYTHHEYNRGRTRMPWRRRLLGLLAAVAMTHTAAALAQGNLENPQPSGMESGIGLVSGWYCTATKIQIQFDNRALVDAAYGTARGDTAGVCGDTNNGFGLLWNYNLLGTGTHRVRAFADGVVFADTTFQVNTLGQEFVTGLAPLSTYVMSLGLGKAIELRWQQSKQGFVISDVIDSGWFYADFIAAYSGTWYGAWTSASPLLSAPINLTLTPAGNGKDLILTHVQMSSTGCAESSLSGGGTLDVNNPTVDIVMVDGAKLELSFTATDDDSMIGGTFHFLSGTCAGRQGFFQMPTKL